MQSSSYWKFAGAFLAIIILAGGGYFVWDRFFSETGKYRRMFAEQERVYKEAEQKYIAAMTADTYGGKTPQETLDMFIDALRKDNTELASKYFALETNENDAENYLTRKKWEQAIAKAKEDGKLSQIVEILSKAQPAGSAFKNSFGFEVRDENNQLIVDIGMVFNTYTKVWKIESL